MTRADFTLKLREFTWLPLAQHRQCATELYRREFLRIYNDALPEYVLELGLTFMEVFRIKVARYVQPLHEIEDDLAPVIGTIRSHDHGWQRAAGYLGEQVIRAYAEGDSDFLKRVEKFSKAKVGAHANYQVWIAIGELLDSGNFGPSSAMSKAMSAVGITEGEWRFFPTKKEVVDHVFSTANNGAERFNALPDHGEWKHIWEQSGAGNFIEKSGRGKGSQ